MESLENTRQSLSAAESEELVKAGKAWRAFLPGAAARAAREGRRDYDAATFALGLAWRRIAQAPPGRERHDYLISVSHTLGDPGHVAVLAVPREPGLLGVGIDIEPRSRSLKPNVVERVSTESELGLGLQPLELWTLKEAAFKSDPKNRDRTVGEYQVLNLGTSNSLQGPNPAVQFRGVSVSDSVLFIAVVLSFDSNWSHGAR